MELIDEVGHKEEHNNHKEYSRGAKEEVLVCYSVLGLQLWEPALPQLRGGEDTDGRVERKDVKGSDMI